MFAARPFGFARDRLSLCARGLLSDENVRPGYKVVQWQTDPLPLTAAQNPPKEVIAA
jgi:hypothetical protein